MFVWYVFAICRFHSPCVRVVCVRYVFPICVFHSLCVRAVCVRAVCIRYVCVLHPPCARGVCSPCVRCVFDMCSCYVCSTHHVFMQGVFDMCLYSVCPLTMCSCCRRPHGDTRLTVHFVLFLITVHEVVTSVADVYTSKRDVTRGTPEFPLILVTFHFG